MIKWSDNWLYLLSQTPFFKGAEEDDLTKFLYLTNARGLLFKDGDTFFFEEGKSYYLLKGVIKIGNLNYYAPFLFCGNFLVKEKIHSRILTKIVVWSNDVLEDLILHNKFQENNIKLAKETKNSAYNFSGNFLKNFRLSYFYILHEQYFLKLNDRRKILINAEDRLWRYLEENYEKNKWQALSITLTDLALNLKMTRQHLYRCFDELENRGFISRKDKKIYLNDLTEQ